MKPRNILKVIDDEAKDRSVEAMNETLVIIVKTADYQTPTIANYESLYMMKDKRDINPNLINQYFEYSNKVELHRISRNILVLVETMPGED